MLLIVLMTVQEQSGASHCLLLPASTQLFWPRSPISLACLREHWAFVSFQNHGCVPRALCSPPPTPALSPGLQAEWGSQQSHRPSYKSSNPSPSEAKPLVHDI